MRLPQSRATRLNAWASVTNSSYAAQPSTIARKRLGAPARFLIVGRFSSCRGPASSQRFDQLDGEPARDEGHGAVHGVGLCNGNDVGLRLRLALAGAAVCGQGISRGALKRFEHGLPAVDQWPPRARARALAR
jgi:hypothetical protein